MRRKSPIIILCAAAMLALGIAGCSGSSKPTGSGSGGAAVVTVGTTSAGLPYSAQSDSGEWTGIEADLWAEVKRRSGWDIQMKQVGDMSSLFGELETGRVDVAANCFAITQERLDSYRASDPLYGDAQVIIVQPDASYQTFEDLRGKTIGVTAGQAAQTTVEDMAPTYDWKVVTYEESSPGFQDLALGRIDCYANTVTNIERAEKAQNLDFRMLDKRLFGNNVAWWLRKNDAGAGLCDKLNGYIADMQADGTMSRIMTKWFGEDMTKYISDDYLTSSK